MRELANWILLVLSGVGRVIVTPTARVTIPAQTKIPLPTKKMLETAFQIVSTLDNILLESCISYSLPNLLQQTLNFDLQSWSMRNLARGLYTKCELIA